MFNCKIKYEDNFGETGFIDNIMNILKLLSYKKIGNMIYRSYSSLYFSFVPSFGNNEMINYV